jgi:hypothetical protein
MPTLKGGSRNKKDIGSVDLVIDQGGTSHLYDLKKEGSSHSAAERWMKNYVKFYPQQPAIPGTVLENYKQILAPIFYSDRDKPGGIYVIEFSLPMRAGKPIPGLIEYKYQFVENKKFTREFQKQFVESRGFAFEPATWKSQALKELGDLVAQNARDRKDLAELKVQAQINLDKAKAEHADAAARAKWYRDHNWLEEMLFSYEGQKEYWENKKRHTDWEVKPNLYLFITDALVKATPQASGAAFSAFAGGLGVVPPVTVPKLAPAPGFSSSGFFWGPAPLPAH